MVNDHSSLIRLLRRLGYDRRANAAAEFALILPVFAIMLCGTLQYGVLFYTWNVSLNAARSAARALAVGKTTAGGAQTMMRNALPPWVGASSGTGLTAVTATATDAVAGSEVSASLVFPSSRATFVPLAPMPANVTVTVYMVKEA